MLENEDKDEQEEDDVNDKWFCKRTKMIITLTWTMELKLIRQDDEYNEKNVSSLLSLINLNKCWLKKKLNKCYKYILTWFI